jgi:transcriptional regulator with XRE-family HTH domain
MDHRPSTRPLVRTPKRSTDIDRLIAARAHECRKLRGMTQCELAQKLGISFQQIQKYEKGTNRLSAGRLFALASALDVSVGDLFAYAERGASGQIDPHNEAQAVVDFALGAEGLELCRAFARIRDGKTRKQVIALMKELG